MFEIPKFSDIHKILKRSFFKRDGVIHLYTEDKKDDNVFYELLFSRLADSNLKILSINQLGSRANVMKRSLEDKRPKAPTLYIIDGDIDLLAKEPIESNNLIGLDRYCIENYLCCEEGLASLLQTNYGNTKEHYKSKIEFESLLHKFCKSFLKIAIRYHVAQNLECPTSYKKASDFFHVRAGGIFELDSLKVRAEILRVESLIKEKLKRNGVKSFKTKMVLLIKEVESKNSFSVSNYLKVISGKDFILPVIEQKIKMVESRLTNWTTDQLKRNLAERAEISNLNRIKQKMESIAG